MGTESDYFELVRSLRTQAAGVDNVLVQANMLAGIANELRKIEQTLSKLERNTRK